METVLLAIFESLFSLKDSHLVSGPNECTANVFLNAATLSKDDKEGARDAMSFEDFRSWCSLLPSVRKYLGSLLMPPGPGFFPLHFSSFIVAVWGTLDSIVSRLNIFQDDV